MKIEKIKPNKQRKELGLVATLRSLKPGQLVRLQTAAEFYGASGAMALVKRETRVIFGMQKDGDDVLIFIKAKP